MEDTEYKFYKHANFKNIYSKLVIPAGAKTYEMNNYRIITHSMEDKWNLFLLIYFKQDDEWCVGMSFTFHQEPSDEFVNNLLKELNEMEFTDNEEINQN